MSQDAVVRILSGSRICGGGFLAAPDVVLTCAHVVRNALGRTTDDAPPAGATVEVVFPPYRSQGITARISRWRPFDLDITALEIDPSKAAGVRPMKLASSPAHDDADFEAFGFPARFPTGRTERGVIWGRTGDGLLEIRPKDTHKYFVEQGFSGVPAVANGSVIGMVNATGPEPEDRLAYLLPSATSSAAGRRSPNPIADWPRSTPSRRDGSEDATGSSKTF